ncbi:hypothetical protein AB1Y20_011672 [Prymnesium parvum]|uniref:Uncharacterized protein n=1 Tax=Prymnesium parvum TaxID=97485 RepID=A0AB34IKM9_PRYPA
MLASLANRGARRFLASKPAMVADSTISCTFILAKKKQKVTVPGQIGWSLLETAQHHGLPVPGTQADTKWDYSDFGEGPSSAEDHVVVQREYFDKLEPMGFQECHVLGEVEEHITGTSRLASCIKLTKELDGITVMLPETNPDLTNYC